MTLAVFIPGEEYALTAVAEFPVKASVPLHEKLYDPPPLDTTVTDQVTGWPIVAEVGETVQAALSGVGCGGVGSGAVTSKDTIHLLSPALLATIKVTPRLDP
ncbi:MAG: hypothetical protein HYT42_02215 [Candidatus Sungbacteria bacterium]|nr:hypothetical protein [Candidatus Sungbacteria bacterium]